MRKVHILPIAVIAFAIVGFLFVLNYSISDGKWPWSTEKVVTSTTMNTSGNVNVEVNSNTSSNTNVTSNTNTTVDTKTDWKTYTNKNHNFSFQYPDNLQISQEQDTATSLVLSIDNGTSIKAYTQSLNIFINPDGLGGVSGYTKFTLGRKGQGFNITKTERNLDNERYEYIATEPKTESQDYFYITWWDNTKNSSASEQLLRTIVSTYKLTSPTADWKTYTNTQNTYSFKYPETTTIEERTSRGEIAILNNGSEKYALVVVTITNPMVSNKSSNPECYKQTQTISGAVTWSINDFLCGIGDTPHPVIYSTTNAETVYEFSKSDAGTAAELEQIVKSFTFTK